MFAMPCHMIAPPPRFAESTFTYNTSSSTLTFSKPTGTVEGDLLLVVLTVRSSTAGPSPAPSGWTLESAYLPTMDGSSCRNVTYTKIAGASEPSSYSWTMSATASSANMQLVCCLLFKSVLGTQPDVEGANNLISSSGTSHAQSSLTSSDPGALAVYIWFLNQIGSGSIATPGVPTDMTQLVWLKGQISSNYDHGFGVYAQVMPSPAALGTKTLTTSSSSASSGKRFIFSKV